nr:hypothetical protein [uncultured Pedobacter sp.]
MNFKMISAIVLKTLGLSKFVKNADGSYDLSTEQRNSLAGVFGEEFVSKFTEKLAAQKDLDASEQTPVAQADDAKGLMDALRNHHASVVADGLKTASDQLKEANIKLAQAEKEKATLQEAVAALAAKPEIDPKAEFPAGLPRKEGVASKMKIDYKNPLYAGAQEFLKTGLAHSYSASTIEVGDLKTEFGTFLSQNQNNLEIVKQLFNGFTSSQYFTTIPAVTEYRAIRAQITSVVQQFTAKWNPGGKSKFTPITIRNRRHKINISIVPAEVLDSYMFKLYDEGLAPDQMPITSYILNELVLPQSLTDVEMRMIWKGKFVDHSGIADGAAATPPEDSMDGLETILVEASISKDKGIHFYNKYPDFDYKDCTDQEMLNYVNGFVDWLSPFYKTTKMPLFCSADFLTRYQRAYKNIWGTNSGQDGDFGTKRVDFSNQMLTPPDGMFNSPIIFSTPKTNMIKLRHKNEVPNIINDVQKVNYEVRLFGEFWLGVGFAVGEAVFAAVPAGYDPKAQIDATLGEFDDYQEYKTDDFGSTGTGV